MNKLIAALAATIFALTAQAQKPVKPNTNQPVDETSKSGKGAPGAQGGKGAANSSGQAPANQSPAGGAPKSKP